MEILLTFVGILAGYFIAHFFNKRALSDLQEIETNLKKDNANLIQEFKALREQLTASKPETAEHISEIIRKYAHGPEAEPEVCGDIDPCPLCKQDTLKFINYSNGPLGHFNAWYGCTNCGHKFQTYETNND